MSGLVDKIKSFVGLVSGFEESDETEDKMIEELYKAGGGYPVKDNLALAPHHEYSKKDLCVSGYGRRVEKEMNRIFTMDHKF